MRLERCSNIGRSDSHEGKSNGATECSELHIRTRHKLTMIIKPTASALPSSLMRMIVNDACLMNNENIDVFSA